MFLKVNSATTAFLLMGLLLASIAAPPSSAQQPATRSGANPQKFALLVGINDYRNMAALRGSVNDVLNMKGVLTGKFGFPEANVRLLTDAAATREAILDAFRQLTEQAKQNPSAIVVFQFSGHGSRVKDEDGDEPDGQDETLVTFDDKTPAGRNTQITDDELDAFISELSRYTPNITIILDSSHSGGATGDVPAPSVAQSRDVSQARPVVAESAQRLRGVSYVIITASLPSEMSFESSHQTAGGVSYNGLLTYHLVRALASATPEATWRDVFGVVEAAVRRENGAQHPQLEGNLRQRIFSDISVTAEVQDYIKIVRVQDNVLTIAAGQAHGLREGAILAVYAPDAERLQGDVKRLAGAKVTFVTAFSATAVLEGAATVPEDAKVVLARASYEPVRLRFALDLSGAAAKNPARAKLLQEVAQRLKASDLVEVVGVIPNPGPPPNVRWDLSVVSVMAPDRKERLCLADANGRTAAEPCVNPEEPSAAERLAGAVEMMARQDNLRTITNEVSPLANKVKLAMLRVHDLTLEGEIRGREELVSHDRFFIPAKQGDFYRALIENQSDATLYVTLLDLETSGGIVVIHPLGGQSQRLGPGESVKTAVFRMTGPAGKETFKLIASATPLDLRFLETQEPIRGTQELKSPLERLLGKALRVKGAAGMGAGENVVDWTTAQVDFVIAAAPEAATMAEAAELAYWERLKESYDPQDFNDYLAKYPNGQFAPLAQKRLALVGVKKLFDDALNLAIAGKYPEGMVKAQEALKGAEAALGAENPGIAPYLNLVGILLYGQSKFEEAEATFKRSLHILWKSPDDNYRELSRTLNYLAYIYTGLGRYEEAEATLTRRLALMEKALGPEHPDVAEAVGDLGNFYRETGDYQRAELYYRRSLSVMEKALGADDPGFATTLVGLAGVYVEKGEFAKAEPLFQRALVIQTKAFGPRDRHVVTTQHVLALAYASAGRRDMAIKLFEQALAGAQTSGDKVLTATLLRNIGRTYEQQHDLDKSLSYFERALVVTNETKSIAGTIDTLNLIGGVYKQKQQPMRALDYFMHALEYSEATHDYPRIVASLSHCADAYLKLGDLLRATKLYSRALGAFEKTGTEELAKIDFDISEFLGGVALTSKAAGEYRMAEEMLSRVLESKRKLLGPEHLEVAVLLRELADLRALQGDLQGALTRLENSNAIRTKHLGLLFGISTEEEKRDYLIDTARETSYTVSFDARYGPREQRATSLAFTTILQRKGRSFDVLGDSMRALQSRLDARDQALFKQLAEARARLASLVLIGMGGGRESKDEVEQLELEVGRLEATLSSRFAELRPQSEPVKTEEVQQQIPDDAALIEIIQYAPFDGSALLGQEWKAPRYVAYVLRRTGGVQRADLGPASVIDAQVLAFRKSLSNPSSLNYKTLGRALERKLMEPIRPLIGTAGTLLLAPDGALDLLPFGALVDVRGRHLIESYSLTYLTSGRDLLRLKDKSPSRQAPLIMADPDFDAADTGGAPPPVSPATNAGLPVQHFRRLPGTALEAAEVASVLKASRVLKGPEATEGALKQVRGPAVIHIATAGYFLADDTRGTAVHRGSTAAFGVGGSFTSGNPLLRSGLAFTGANRLRSGEEDGVLTALEAGSLDLWGTKLAVLSACDTGVGEVRNGDGVYGMRRAFMTAGAESLVTSLWKVDDEATRGLMAGYYRELLAGVGRGEALRRVQLATLRNAKQRHPYYWAAFTLTGQWTPLDPALLSGGAGDEKGGVRQ